MEMFSDHEYVERYPHNGDTYGYFPTMSIQKSIDFAVIDPRPDKYFPVIENTLSVNTI